MIVHVLFPHQPVTAQRQAVVAGKDHHRVGQAAISAQLIQHAANLAVNVIHHCVIHRQLLQNLLTRSRPRQQFFIAAGKIAVIKGVPWQKIFRQLHFGRRVFLFVTGRIDQWIMRSREVDVQKKRSLRFAFQERHGPIANVVIGQWRETDTLGEIRLALRILKRPIAIARNGSAFAPANHLLFFPRTTTRAEQRLRFLITPRGRLAVVHPFAAVPCVIAAGRHRRGPESELGIHALATQAQHAVAKPRAAGENLRPTWYTQRIGTNEVRPRLPVLHEPIQIRRLNPRIT